MDNGGGPKPPWGGFGTFWNFVSQLHDDGGVPQILDRSVMGNRGGSARTELYAALRFLGLINEDKRPTDRLHTLAADPTAARLRTVIELAYEPVVKLGLMTATASQVGDALAEMGATPSTITRARTFFLNAAEQAGIPVGNTLKTKRAPSTPSRRRARPKKAAPPTDEAQRSQVQRPKLPPLIEALIAKLPAESWTADEAKQWLGLVAPAIAYDYGLDLNELQPASKGDP